MANDLVKRLRDYEEYEQSRDGQIICVKSDMAQEAATYIEQLEAENRELAMQVLASGSQAQEAYEAQLKAEAATAAAYEVAAKVAKDGNFCFAFQMEKHIRADLAAVQPAQVQPDCCDICRGKTFAETTDGKGWRCVECKAVWLREPQPDPRDEVIARLVEAADAVDNDYISQQWGPEIPSIEQLRAAIAAAKELMK